MAINLWTKSTSFNPLPTGYVNSVTVKDVTKLYVIKFRAKSPSGARISIVNGSYSYFNTFLTTEFKDYEAVVDRLNSAITTQYIYDSDSKGDIIVEGIQFVEKGLEKATFNGVDGFLSKKWNFHANSTIIDDSTLELNATGDNANIIPINVNPSTEYTLSVDMEGSGGYVGGLIANGGTTYSWIDSTIKYKTFTTGATQKVLQIHVKRTTTGKTVFKNVMLNLGSYPLPYEPKRGERMIPPVYPKNLVKSSKLNAFKNIAYTFIGKENGYDKYSISGTWNDGTYPYSVSFGEHGANFKPSVSYSASVQIYTNVPEKFTSEFGKMTLVNDLGMQGVRKMTRNGNYSSIEDVIHSSSFYANNQFYIYSCPIANGTTFNPATDFVFVKEFQVEEGKVATPYMPLSFKMNKSPSKFLKPIYKPTDFGLNYTFTPLGEYSFNSSGSHYYVEGRKNIPVLPNTEYTYSYRQEVITGGACWTNVLFYETDIANPPLLGESPYGNSVLNGYVERTFTTPPNCNFIALRVARSNSNRAFDVNHYDFKFGIKGITENKPTIKSIKNYADKSDFLELSSATTGLAKPLVQYGVGGYSISDDVYIPNTKSQRIQWTSPANNGVGMLNRGVRLTLADSEFSNLVIGEMYILSFYGKGWEPNGGVGWYAVNVANSLVLTRDIIGNGWYRYSLRFRYTGKDGLIYIRPNNNTDYSYDCIMNGLQIESYNVDAKPTTYKSFEKEDKPSRKGLEFDGNSRVVVDHANLNGFDVETEFVWYGAVSGSNYSMLWSLNGNANYVAIRNSDKSLFISTKAQGGIQHANPMSLIISEGVKYKIRLVYDASDFTVKVYSDGVLIYTFQETAKLQTDVKSVISSLTPNGQQSQFRGVILSQELKDVYKFDFTKQDYIMGTTVKAVTGLDGTITGNPLQLLKRAKR